MSRPRQTALALFSPSAEARHARAIVEAALAEAGWVWSRRLSAWIDLLVVIEEAHVNLP